MANFICISPFIFSSLKTEYIYWPRSEADIPVVANASYKFWMEFHSRITRVDLYIAITICTRNFCKCLLGSSHVFYDMCIGRNARNKQSMKGCSIDFTTAEQFFERMIKCIRAKATTDSYNFFWRKVFERVENKSPSSLDTSIERKIWRKMIRMFYGKEIVRIPTVFFTVFDDCFHQMGCITCLPKAGKCHDEIWPTFTIA